MLTFPHTLSIITTHRCTAACESCCFGCSPTVEKSIPPENIADYIDQAAEIRSMRLVVFTGGECFLLGSKLDELVGRANGYGLSTRFVSNGYWATSRNNAARRIGKLVEAGLTEANFSTGDMHAAYVSPTYVRNGAIASADAGLTTVIMLELFKENEFDLEAFLDDQELRRHIDSGRVLLRASPWMPFSESSAITYSSVFLDKQQEATKGCTSLFNVVAINPDEHLIACCGLTLEEIEEVHLGDLRKNSIKEILESSPNDLIKIWIHLEGPDAVIEYARSVDPSIAMPRSMAHICDKCRFMYHEPRIREVVMKTPPPNRHEIVRRFYSSALVRMAESKNIQDQSIGVMKSVCTVENARMLSKLIKEESMAA